MNYKEKFLKMMRIRDEKKEDFEKIIINYEYLTWNDYFRNDPGCMEDIKNNRKDSPIYTDFLRGKSDHYLKSTPALQVRDYIAGMTDRYFTHILKTLVVPDISLGELNG